MSGHFRTLRSKGLIHSFISKSHIFPSIFDDLPFPEVSKIILQLKFPSYEIGPVNITPFRPVPGQREKINLNFYFHTSFRCLKRFYEKKGLKPFEASQRSVKIKILVNFYLLQFSEMRGTGGVNFRWTSF